MDVAKFFRKLALAPKIEIVVASLPERIGCPQGQSAGYALLQRLHGLSERTALRLVYQQVHVLGHDYVSVHAEPELLSNSFQSGLEDDARRDALEIWLSVITAESKEVKLAGFVKAL
jgi:hypothetical protein